MKDEARASEKKKYKRGETGRQRQRQRGGGGEGVERMGENRRGKNGI